MSEQYPTIYGLHEEAFRKVAAELKGDGFEIEVYDQYSGRGMYGRHTLGVTMSHDTMFMFLQALGAELAETSDDYIDSFTMDTMGRDIILYFK